MPLTATAFYYYDVWILAETARLLGESAAARKYAGLAEQIRSAFNTTFFDSNLERYATGSQCANSLALVMGLVAPTNRAAVLENIVEDVRSRGNALTAGDVGYRYLLRALAEGGRSDVIFDLNNQSVKPGYGYQLARGATSLTEAWDAGRQSSQNHFMLGQLMEWFYHDLAGIQCDASGPGFKRIIIRPSVVGDLTWARASYNSIRGRIVSNWERKGDRLELRVSIPANTTATVFVPARSPDEVRENGQPLRRGRATLVRTGPDSAVCAIESGDYVFESRW